jgi:hypothetical protein
MKTAEIVIKAKAYAESIGNKDGTSAYDYVMGYNQCQEDIDEENQDWTNFESELMDWAHELGREQKYIPFPVQVLEWIKNNYKIPQKK